MARVFDLRTNLAGSGTAPRSNAWCTALTGVDETHEMRWPEYADAMLVFSLVSMLLLYV